MGVFVGAEYLIANALISLRKKGISKIAIPALQSFGIDVQQYCSQKQIDAIFLLSADKVFAAIYNFSDYFSFEKIENVNYISINKDTPVEDLENRFIGYLPVDVVMAILEKAQTLR
jgi:hypothetical protein